MSKAPFANRAGLAVSGGESCAGGCRPAPRRRRRRERRRPRRHRRRPPRPRARRPPRRRSRRPRCWWPAAGWRRRSQAGRARKRTESSA
ncbi:hypothetical protein F0L46_21485 [Salinarimonas soli]|uniref:Uncharacterized protein n=1 Tax=Salinarimonas soli TaxID=1638099 RepID=A0A5B2V8Z2_9HYPH|nr:hypothetical protein F0L46_21485 [Salinarimonas soli]